MLAIDLWMAVNRTFNISVQIVLRSVIISIIAIVPLSLLESHSRSFRSECFFHTSQSTLSVFTSF